MAARSATKPPKRYTRGRCQLKQKPRPTRWCLPLFPNSSSMAFPPTPSPHYNHTLTPSPTHFLSLSTQLCQLNHIPLRSIRRSSFLRTTACRVTIMQGTSVFRHLCSPYWGPSEHFIFSMGLPPQITDLSDR